MAQVFDRISGLSDEEKRALAARLLREKGRLYPLSYNQRALWIEHQRAPESAAYNVSFAARIRGEVNVPALRRSFQSLVDRHPALRTSIITVDERPAQRIHTSQDVCFLHNDASALSEEELGASLIAENTRPFDLKQGPLLRVNLFTRSADEHVLLLTVHHIIGDYWSLVVIIDEIGILYAGETGKECSPLPPLETQYTDYVRWQTNLLESPEGDRLRAYWEKHLAGELSLLDLPTDRPRPPAQTHRAKSSLFILSKEMTQELASVAKSEATTSYVILLSALEVLLHRYTSQEEVHIGSPLAGRNLPEFTGIVGNFINPVVMRGDLSGNPTVRDLLKLVRETTLMALDHQDYPFPLLVERLQPDRDPARSPLFQVMFVLEKAHRSDRQGCSLFIAGHAGKRLDLNGLILESLDFNQQALEFDLSLMMEEVDGSLFGSLQYNSDLFDRTTIERMVRHYERVMEWMVRDAGQRVSELEMLREWERAQILIEWNETGVDEQAEYGECLQAMVERQVERTPDAVAVVSREVHLTYEEINRRANQLASYLIERGARPEEVVGICLKRGERMVVGVLGVVKSGAGYLPIDERQPDQRVSYVIEESRARLVITDQECERRVEGKGCEVVNLDRDFQEISRCGEDNVESGVMDRNLAYVIYTSGSTGRPKGVAIEHRSTVRLLMWAAEEWSREEMERVLASTSLSFDLSVFEMMGPLSVGGTVVVVEDALEVMGEGWVEEVTLINTVPSAMREIIRGERGVSQAVRVINLAGEALGRELVEEIYRESRVERVMNLYGPSEDTTYTTYSEVRRAGRGVRIGRPITGTRVYVVGRAGEEVAIGVRGGLEIAGIGLARGYVGRGELTAERFVPDEKDERGGGRRYRTGDEVRWAREGEMEYVGREDNQVKVRGYRIEMGEVEAVMEEHEAIREAVVVAVEEEGEGGGVKRLKGYVVEVEASAQYFVSADHLAY